MTTIKGTIRSRETVNHTVLITPTEILSFASQGFPWQSDFITGTPINGAGPFNYSWAWVSGGSGITINSPTSPTTILSIANPQPPGYSGTLRCTITDTGNGNFINSAQINVSVDVS